MLASQIPVKFTIPFAYGPAIVAPSPTYCTFVGPVPGIPTPSQIGVTANAASFTDGFPPLNFAAGNAPRGNDFNALMYMSTSWNQWFSVGGPIKWDSAQSAAVGGYPQGSVVSAATLGQFWLSSVDANTTNPDTGGAGWQPLFGTQIGLITGTSTNYATTQIGTQVNRSNSGTAMSDVLPGTSPGQLPAGASIRVFNADASAILAISTGAGATLKGSLAYNGFLILGPAQSATITSDGTNYWISGQPVRIALGANTTLYVSPAGSDTANSGLSVGSPFQTRQQAWNVLLAHYDLNGFNVLVQSANSASYTDAVVANAPILGQRSPASIVFQGSATPSNVIVTTASTPCFSATNGAAFTVQGMTIAGTGTASGLAASNGGQINFSNSGFPITFGSMGTGQQIVAGNTGIIIGLANYTISGGAGEHIAAQGAGSTVDVHGLIVTVSGTPAFSSGFAVATQTGVLSAFGMTFAGGATGTRYVVSLNAVINTSGGGANYFPGNAAGSNPTGGQYA